LNAFPSADSIAGPVQIHSALFCWNTTAIVKATRISLQQKKSMSIGNYHTVFVNRYNLKGNDKKRKRGELVMFFVSKYKIIQISS